ncbi:MAG: hypothetical protein HQK94_03180, partial [Nitrospirae bacterium]|nr:hypothetical protein [Nitrospirota bacterium]
MVDTEKLAEVANRINQKSDDLQTTLQKIQDKINGLNIGLEVWLSNPILSRETPSIVTDRRCTLDVYLGYAKTFSGWGLVSQEKVYSQSLGDDDEWIHDSC